MKLKKGIADALRKRSAMEFCSGGRGGRGVSGKQATRLPLQSGEVRRSMREHAPDQFSKRCDARRTGVERCRMKRNFRRRESDQLRESKIDMVKVANRKVLNRSRGNRAQDLAARRIVRLFLFLRRGLLGMKRALIGRSFRFRRSGPEGTVIGNGKPRRKRDEHRQDRQNPLYAFHLFFHRPSEKFGNFSLCEMDEHSPHH